jgi:predicted dehydrogenase
MTIGIGVVGYGYWGPNLARNFASQADAKVVGIADLRAEARAWAKQSHPHIAVVEDAEALFTQSDLDAVVIATPVSTHYSLAVQALNRGLHVLIEKPLCENAAHGEDLIARAKRAGRVLMVDHTFLFTGAVQTMAKVIKSGDLGRICYIDSVRVNLGLFQPDVNCLWDLAPHDLSIVDHLIDDYVVNVDATGHCHVNSGIPDLVYLTLHFANNAVAHFNLSWMSPVKIRRFLVGGTNKMLIWDDLDHDQKLKIYDCGICFQPEAERAHIIPDYRIGDIYSPRVPIREALCGVADHFIKVIRGEERSIMDGERGLRVVRLLETAQEVLSRNLAALERERCLAKRERA